MLVGVIGSVIRSLGCNGVYHVELLYDIPQLLPKSLFCRLGVLQARLSPRLKQRVKQKPKRTIQRSRNEMCMVMDVSVWYCTVGVLQWDKRGPNFHWN